MVISVQFSSLTSICMRLLQTRGNKRSTISEVVADRHELMIY